MEITTAAFLLQMFTIVNSNLYFTRNTVCRYIYVGDWERGFNLFALAAILILISKWLITHYLNDHFPVSGTVIFEEVDALPCSEY